LRRTQRRNQINVLLRKVCAPVESAIIPKNLRKSRFGQHSNFVSGMKFRKVHFIRLGCEAYAQPALRALLCAF
jgi:hypothetical protein